MSTDEDMDTSINGRGPPDPIAFLCKLDADDNRLDLPLNDSDDNDDDEEANGDDDNTKHEKKKRRIPQDPPARERPAVSTILCY
jgi:hypothetical protein